MPGTLVLEPADQARRRRRARITQSDIAKRLNVALSSISEYENGKEPLPWALTADDYERALAAAITEKGKAA